MAERCPARLLGDNPQWPGRANRRARRVSPFKLGPAHQSGRRCGDLGGQPAGFFQILRRSPPDACRSREPPARNARRRSLVAFDLADLAHEIGGVVPVAGFDGQVEQREPDTEIVRLEGRQLAPVLSRQVRFAEPDLDVRRADRGTPVDRQQGSGRESPPVWPPRPWPRRRPATPQ